jgi:PMP-22/EMP/MP20/Claudin family.
MSIYTDQHAIEGKDMEYGWSFGLGWASFVFTLIAGILACFGGVEYEEM